jgi:acyl-CoA thioesterase II
MVSVRSIVSALDLEPVGEGRYRGVNVPTGHPVVFGGQLLAQSMVAAARGHDDKTVKTLHTVFARAADPDQPVDISVDPVHAGRSLASSTVTISQGERVCVRSMVLLSAPEPDLIRHGERADGVGGPGDDTDGPIEPDDGNEMAAPWSVRIVGDVDLADPDSVGPAELDVWTRFPGAPADPVLNQALLAFATDGFLIGTAMRPHRGVGQAQAHVTLSTGVLSHTLTFHEPLSAAEWLLLRHVSPYTGQGRGYGRADVFRGDGELVASFVQDSMIRAMPARQGEGGPAL